MTSTITLGTSCVALSCITPWLHTANYNDLTSSTVVLGVIKRRVAFMKRARDGHKI